MKTQLTRSTTNKQVAGVAGGIAEAFGWDVTLVRLGFVALTLLHGGGLLLYILLLLVMPRAGQSSVAAQALVGVQHAGESLGLRDRNRTVGMVLIGVGALLLLSVLNLPGPLVALLIMGGGYYLIKQR